MAGSRQDLAMEGAAAVYWNRRYYVEFLDECLRGCNDNILQENLFIVLTSVEMVTLCQTMAILHFKICMPLRWLAGNTHFIGQQGYDWSARSMGKAVDALYDAMNSIQQDCSLYLSEHFMNSIFDKICKDEIGNHATLPLLQDVIQYQYKMKQTNAIDGSKVLPYNQMNAEMFYPSCQENVDTTPIVEDMAANELAHAMLGELCDPIPVTADPVKGLVPKV